MSCITIELQCLINLINWGYFIMRRNAFTLAETLITLGVIGVVAAITMPMLIVYHRNLVLKTQFNKAYNELQQINQSFIKDYDLTKVK